MIALTENRNMRQVWHESYYWSFPFYLSGASVVWLIIVLNRMFGWQAWVGVVPMMYAVYRAYKLYLERLEADKRQAIVKAQFLANMSHEIRTPINGVIGMTALLTSTPLSGEQREYTETIQKSANALLTIINDILDFSKMEADRMRLEAAAFAWRPLSRTQSRLFAPMRPANKSSSTSKSIRRSHAASARTRADYVKSFSISLAMRSSSRTKVV